jgi:hypothetical protein
VVGVAVDGTSLHESIAWFSELDSDGACHNTGICGFSCSEPFVKACNASSAATTGIYACMEDSCWQSRTYKSTKADRFSLKKLSSATAAASTQCKAYHSRTK